MWGGESRHRALAGKTYFEKIFTGKIASQGLIF